ncbi:GPP34 family phosphoprotein [Streptomyces sp. NPDC051211]|uniref:GOLPH3/VPS74 family protein n=1 Tax=Streptomyces sp. NPDC051211 TaxID=3154643 RepID=UPI00344E585D
METTLGEQIMLLSLDDTTGAQALQPQSEFMISSASLLELGLAGRIRLDEGRVLVTDSTPLGIPVLDAALAAIGAAEQPEDAQAWIYRLKQEAVEGARQGLLEKGIIREEKTRRWGIFPTHRYPEVDGAPEAGVRAKLAAAVLEGERPDDRTAALIVLLHSGGLETLVFGDRTDKAEQEAVRARMGKLAEGHWAEPAMQQLADSVNVALAGYAATTVAAINTGN